MNFTAKVFGHFLIHLSPFLKKQISLFLKDFLINWPRVHKVFSVLTEFETRIFKTDLFKTQPDLFTAISQNNITWQFGN